MIKIYTFLFFHLLCLSVNAQLLKGVHGNVKNDEGTVLPFATIFVKETGTGVTTNVDGNYEVFLTAGHYQLVFQYLGYETQIKEFDVDKDFINYDVVLKTQATVLQTVTVKSGQEDPAYTIMRKAIAKAKYHTQQLDSYSARVYIKGSGKLIDYPWLAKSTLKKEGIEKGRVYTSESISDVKYTRPKKFEQKVISIRSDGKDNNTSPNGYIFGSFYEPEIAETISPLSPKAFSYYKFEYQGTFKDRNYDISRIKVTPRSKGDNVVDGTIYIVEDWWSIHSIDIHTTKLGINAYIKAMYEPIEDKAWMPVSHRFKMAGKIFGFEFEYNYLATVSDYKIKLNPKLVVPKMDVVDEKVDKQHAKEVEKSFEKKVTQSKGLKQKVDQTKKLQERLAAGQEITRKELNTLVKQYEKEDRKQQKEPEVISDVNFKIDSSGYKKDSSYWATVRPIPLTHEEVKGYEKIDSMASIQKRKDIGDTLKDSKHKGFQLYDIIIGDHYKIFKHSDLKIYTPIPGFNTVDGFNLNYRLSFGTNLPDTNKTRFTVSPLARYAFGRKKLSGTLQVSLRNKKYKLKLEGGQYIRQFNQDEPILPIVNTFTTLLLEENLMKIYEREFIDLTYQRNINQFLNVSTTWSWSNRHHLFNTTDFKWVNRKNIEGYTSNDPVNNELFSTAFLDNKAFIGSLSIVAQPWLKFRIRNGKKQAIGSSSPTFMLDYKKGFNNILDSDVNFDQLELGVKYHFDIGVRGRLDFAFKGGAFLNTNKMYFMDYKHFLGNRTPFVTNDPVGSFRLLDYYKYSTSDKYFAGNVYYHFRKFLLTTIPLVRLAGVRENIFINYLATPTSRNYTEVGYSIDGILRILRVEVAASFQNDQFINYGFRVGIASYLAVNFSDN